MGDPGEELRRFAERLRRCDRRRGIRIRCAPPAFARIAADAEVQARGAGVTDAQLRAVCYLHVTPARGQADHTSRQISLAIMRRL